MTSTQWFDKPMRWAQLTLTDTDPGSFDPDFWLEYFRRARCDGAVIGTGGYMAFHPTDIPYHYRAAMLGDSDVFGYLVEGCRKMNMSVLCRSDAHAVHDDARAAHPEWIAVTEDGEPRPHWAMPGVWITCALGPYTFEFMDSVNREIVERYQVDGIFCNRWSGSGICHCASCRTLFREHAGIEIPKLADRESDAMVAYLEWRESRLFELCEHWDATIRSVNPSARFIPNSGGGALSDLDMVRLGEYSDILFIDRQSRHGTMPPWANGRNGKELRSVMPAKPIGGIFSTGIEEEFRWKDSVQNGPELRVWVAEAVANGMRPWFTKFCGRVYDDRWMPVVEKIYNTYADWEPYLRLSDPVADVAIGFSQDTARHYARGRARDLVDSPISGFYQALLEDRTLFEMAHAKTWSAERLSQFKALVLPNVAALSAAQCDAVREYVRAGGGLVASFETSLYDERGRRRDDFGLADVFGVHADGKVEGPMKNSYLCVNHDSAFDRGTIHRGLEDAGRIINAVYRVPVSSGTASWDGTPYSSVPSYPDLPMEEVYPRETAVSSPEIFYSTFGKGRVVYMNGDLDRRFWEFLTPDHAKLLANNVLWTIRGERTIEVTGNGYVDVTCWRDDRRVCLHVVNMTNPHAMRGALRAAIPVSGLSLKVRVPGGVAGPVTSLSTRRTLDVHVDAEWVLIELPPIEVHEAIVFELNPGASLGWTRS